MDRILDLKVFEPNEQITAFFSESEQKLEAQASRALGQPVDIVIKKQSLNTITRTIEQGGWGSMCVAHLTNEKNVANQFDRLLKALGNRSFHSILIVTTCKNFNNKLQSLTSEYCNINHLKWLIEPSSELNKPDVMKQLQRLFKATLPDLLEQKQRLHEPYLKISKDIRNEETGRLDAAKIATVFGIPKSKLAEIAGVTRQAISKTPDSSYIQEKLFPFEKITRGMLMMDQNSLKEFRRWLNTPSDDLAEYEGKMITPLDMIKFGYPEVVASLVKNMLTGHPT